MFMNLFMNILGSLIAWAIIKTAEMIIRRVKC